MALPRSKMLSKYCDVTFLKKSWPSSPEPPPMEPTTKALSEQLFLLATALTRSQSGILPRLSHASTGHCSWGDRWFCVLTAGLTGSVWQACAVPASSWLNLGGIRIPLERMGFSFSTGLGFSSAGVQRIGSQVRADRDTTVLRWDHRGDTYGQ